MPLLAVGGEDAFGSEDREDSPEAGAVDGPVVDFSRQDGFDVVAVGGHEDGPAEGDGIEGVTIPPEEGVIIGHELEGFSGADGRYEGIDAQERIEKGEGGSGSTAECKGATGLEVTGDEEDVCFEGEEGED